MSGEFTQRYGPVVLSAGVTYVTITLPPASQEAPKPWMAPVAVGVCVGAGVAITAAAVYGYVVRSTRFRAAAVAADANGGATAPMVTIETWPATAVAHKAAKKAIAEPHDGLIAEWDDALLSLPPPSFGNLSDAFVTGLTEPSSLRGNAPAAPLVSLYTAPTASLVGQMIDHALSTGGVAPWEECSELLTLESLSVHVVDDNPAPEEAAPMPLVATDSRLVPLGASPGCMDSEASVPAPHSSRQLAAEAAALGLIASKKKKKKTKRRPVPGEAAAGSTAAHLALPPLQPALVGDGEEENELDGKWHLHHAS